MNKKILLITGGSSDFGLRYIEKYHENYDVILAHYNQSIASLEEIRKKVGEKLCLLQADLQDETSTREFIDYIKIKYGNPTHILHLPANKLAYTRFTKTTWDEIEKAITVQVKSAYLILREFIPEMAKEKSGRIVFMLTSYTCDMVPPKHMLSYITAKYMLLGLMKSLSSDYADKNITINAVSPSMTDTKFLCNTPHYISEQTAEQHPLKRIANVDDVVPTIHHLLSDDAGYITGQNILISGGS